MAIEEVVENLSLVLSPEIASRVSGFILILKALGVFAIVYVIYVVVMGVLGFRSRRKLKVIEKKVNAIDKKLNKLMKSKPKK